MTENEKEAIEDIKKTNGDILREIDNLRICLAEGVEKREIIIKALREKLDKLQKENEELHKEIERQGNVREIEEEYIEKKFISKDKIREKIDIFFDNLIYAKDKDELKEALKEELLEESE